MEEPRSRIVGEEPDSDLIITTITNRHHISDDRVVEVVGCTIGAADYMKTVPMQMNRVLLIEVTGLKFMILKTAIRCNLLDRQRHQRELSAQRSCSHRDHRCCHWEEDPMLSGNH